MKKEWFVILDGGRDKKNVTTIEDIYIYFCAAGTIEHIN